MSANSSYARIFLVGNASKDAEVKTVGDDKKMAKFSMATDDGWGDKKTTTWWNITVFGKEAEFVGKDLKKGAMVSVVGRVYERKYEKEGVEHKVMQVDAERVSFDRPKASSTPTETKKPDTANDDW